ncbi:hypothetical protein TBH_C0098 [Thiolapillus brandeum]|uniref:diguanylate cyclase n=2 Tax=Thiolapillus brandeum TaxID=1076588 RepID=A0A7U6GG88_9GAMM|nr:hypothetical protein TBH_C0098 [Thiolapillus brandeum]
MRCPGLLILLLLFSSPPWAYANSDLYDTLEKQIGSAPDKVLQQATPLLAQATKQGNAEEQLRALALIVMSALNLGDFDQAGEKIQQGLTLAKQSNLDNQLASFLIYNAQLLTIRGQDIKALESINPAISLAKILDDDLLLSEALATRGQVLMNQELHAVALKDLLVAQQIMETIPDLDISLLGDLYNEIAMSYMSTGNHKNAIALLKKSLLITDPDDLRAITVTKYNIASCYLDLGQYAQAKKLFSETQALTEQIHDKQGMAMLVGGYAKLLLAQDRLKQAVPLLEKAIDLFDELNLPVSQTNLLLLLADTERQLGYLEKAERHLQQAATFLETLKMPSLHIKLLKSQSELAAARHDYQKAYELLKKEESLEQGTRKKTQQKQLSLLQARFDFALKDSENRLLKQASARQSERSRIITGAAIIIILIITAAYAYENRLKRKMALLALQDDLTGAANRRQITSRLREEMERAKRYQHPLSIAMVDLDHFKHINDKYGHDTGDKVLKYFANAAKATIRSQDLIGRVGGEEWLFIFPHAEAGEARNILKRLASRYANNNITGINPSDSLTFSVGITELHADDLCMEDPLRRADNALYEAKNNGRNQILIAT